MTRKLVKKTKRKRTGANSGIATIGLSQLSGIARVVGEPGAISYGHGRSHIVSFANLNRRRPTPSERRFKEILGAINGGVLRGRFKCQHAISGKWIVDFFVPEIRLGIEIDG